MPTTNNVKQVKLKVMTEAQFENITPNDNEFYAITDAEISYNDLTDKPTIGNATLTIQKNGTAVDTFTANATSDKTINITIPTKASDIGALPDTTIIPTVYNGTLTIQKNGANVQTFTANQSSNVTANITVPTNTNELTNGAGFITNAGTFYWGE